MKSLKTFARTDIILILAVTAVLSIWIGLLYLKPNSTKAVILVHGKIYKTVPLDKDSTFNILWKGVYLSTVQVKSGAIRVVKSTCLRKICVHTGWISKDGQAIVCLPNRVIIYTEGAKKSVSYDVMTSQ